MNPENIGPTVGAVLRQPSISTDCIALISSAKFYFNNKSYESISYNIIITN